MGRKRRTQKRKEVEVKSGKLRSITDVKMAGDLMLKGYKLINSYFNAEMNKPVFCFADSKDLNKTIARIREYKLLNGYM